MKKIASLILAFAILVFAHVAIAQEVAITPLPSTTSYAPFSPSITSFQHSGQEWNLCAYAYSPALDGNHRKVAISRSTNGGSTWSVITTLSSPTYPNQGCTNSTYSEMDDPQILSLGNGTFVCVVKAWAADNGSYNNTNTSQPWITTESTNQYGYRESSTLNWGTGNFYYGDLAHTIFAEAAILIATSTDEGAHWSWGSQPVATTGWCSGSTDISTVEHPRIAFRTGFDSKGYVVWQQKTWLKNAPFTGTDSSYSTHTGDNPSYLRITGSQIAIRAFKSDGTLYNSDADIATRSFNNSTDDNSVGPELPSVAISPEGAIWIAYDRIAYWKDGSGNFNKLQWWGLQPPLASLYVLSASCSISATGTATYTYATQQKVVTDHIMGFYNPGRGYLYASAYDNKGNPSSFANLDGELASGPSIQVACINPRSCSAPYTVGVVQAWGDGRLTTTYGNQTWPGSGIDQSWLSFIRADVHRFGGVAEWWGTNNNPNPTLNFNKTAAHQFDNGNPYGDQVDWPVAAPTTAQQGNNGANYAMRWFPILKYVSAPDGIDNPSDIRNRASFFVLSWMSGFCFKATDVDASGGHIAGTRMNKSPAYIDSAVCRTAVSFDNHSFTLVSSSATYPLIHNTSFVGLGSAGAVSSAGPMFWGTKMDVGADGNDFTIHPIWREPTNLSPTSSSLYCNTGACILVRPYASSLQITDPNVFPVGATNSSWYCIKNAQGSSYPFGPLGVFTMGTTTANMPSVSANDFGYKTTVIDNTTSTTYTELSGITASSIVNPGLYDLFYWHAPTSSTVALNLGSLENGSQRKIVTNQNTTFAIGSNPPNTPYAWIDYSTQTVAIKPIEGTPYQNPWVPSVPLNMNQGPTALVRSAPAIATYSRSKTSSESAEAVCWIGYDCQSSYLGPECPVVCVRTLEVSCPSDISNWSDRFSIPLQGYWSGDMGVTVFPGPSIAPLTVQGPNAGERYLLGWVVTVNTDNRLKEFVLLRGAQGTTGTNPAAMQNEDWGKRYNKFTWAPDNLDPNRPAHVVIDDEILSNPLWRCEDRGFVSITSNENNAFDIKNDQSAANGNTHEIAFSGGGVGQPAPWTGSGTCWITKATFSTNANTVGNLLTAKQSNGMDGAEPLPKVDILPKLTRSANILVDYDRKPCVTLNSIGQNLVAWEHIEGYTNFITVHHAPGLLNAVASIRLAKTKSNGTWDPIQDFISEPASSYEFEWLLDPSLTAFPKTRLDPNTQDPNAAELLYWSKQGQSGSNKLHAFVFNHPVNKDAWINGSWNQSEVWGYPTNGINSQRSFGVYNNGPEYPNINPKNAPPMADAYMRRESYAIGNDASDPSQIKLLDPPADIASYAGKFGTYEAPLSVDLYRSETRVKDSSKVTFKWGKVYVEDSSLGLPTRQIILHDGRPDSNGYSSTGAMRDSIFATEWFNWPVSAEIKYDRLLLVPSAGHRVMALDTITIDSVANDSTGLYAFHAFDTVYRTVVDSGYRTDSSFMVPGTRMAYTVELWHASGHIDTVERVVYNPFTDQYIPAIRVHIENAGNREDTVQLRVRGDFLGIPDGDSVVLFGREMMSGSYPVLGDTTIAINSSGIIPPDSTGCLQVIGPFPNPSAASATNVSILVSYCHSGQTVTAQVFNSLASPVGSPVSLVSDGHSWDRLQIPAPSSPGTYFIRVSAEFFSQSLPYSVY